VSSRGSRITGDLSAFFGKDKHSARSPVPEEEELEPTPTGMKPPGMLESLGAASGGGSTPGLPPSDMRATPAYPARAVDSDGFEVDSSEDAMAAAAHRPVTHVRRASFLNKSSGGAGQRDTEQHQTTPPTISSHQKKSFSMLEEMNARRNRVAAIRGDAATAGSPPAAGASPETERVTTSATGGHVRQQSVGMRADRDSGGATPDSQVPADKALPAAASPTALEDEAAARHKTGKTTYIRDWLGSAEPAPGEGPSVRFPKAADSPDANLRTGLPSTLEEVGSKLSAMQFPDDEEATEDPERRQLAHSLSSAARNHDLRMVLDQDRIHKESESIMKDLDEAAAAAAQVAEELEMAPNLNSNGHRSSANRVQDASGGLSPGAQEDADGTGAKRRFGWQRRRSSTPGAAATTVPEDRAVDMMPGEVASMGMGNTLGVGDLLKTNRIDAATEDIRAIEADRLHVERLAEYEEKYAEAELRLRAAEDRIADAEASAADAERQAATAQQRLQAYEEQADALRKRVDADSKAADAAERKAKARLEALQAETQAQEAACNAAKARAAQAEEAARQQLTRQEEAATDAVLDSLAPSSSFVLETGPLDGVSARVGAKKAGKVQCLAPFTISFFTFCRFSSVMCKT
jgi:hypothetical protein